MAILESVRELASKLGAETNGRDITDQINKINKHLDETALGGRDIAEAVKTYSKNASGGGGGGLDNPTYFMIRKTTKTGPFTPATFIESDTTVELYQSDNGIVTIPKQVHLEESHRMFGGVVILLGDVNRINIVSIDNAGARTMIFKAGSKFDGLYINDTKITISDTITAGLWYTLYVENNNGSYDVLIDEQYPTSIYTDSGVIPIS